MYYTALYCAPDARTLHITYTQSCAVVRVHYKHTHTRVTLAVPVKMTPPLSQSTKSLITGGRGRASNSAESNLAEWMRVGECVHVWCIFRGRKNTEKIRTHAKLDCCPRSRFVCRDSGLRQQSTSVSLFLCLASSGYYGQRYCPSLRRARTLLCRCLRRLSAGFELPFSSSFSLDRPTVRCTHAALGWDNNGNNWDVVVVDGGAKKIRLLRRAPVTYTSYFFKRPTALTTDASAATKLRGRELSRPKLPNQRLSKVDTTTTKHRLGSGMGKVADEYFWLIKLKGAKTACWTGISC